MIKSIIYILSIISVVSSISSREVSGMLLGGNDLYVLFDADFVECRQAPPSEICDNGIDDDGDGLVDVFDQDCACANEGGTTSNYIINPGFEEHTGCCTSMLTDGSCIDNWEVIGGSPDYYGLDCIPNTQIAEIEALFSNPFDNSFISMGTQGNFAETIGTCLISPLTAGKSYEVEMLVSFPDDLLINLTNPIDLALYGFSGPCPDFSNLIGSSTGSFCSNSISNLGQELITVSSADLLNLQFLEFNSTFIASSDINYVVLSIRCDDSNQGGTFFQVAYVQISDPEKTWIYDEIVSIENLCSDPILLSLPHSDTLNYQWYVDSLPMSGEVRSSLEVDPNLYSSTNVFHVYVYNDRGCVLVGPSYIIPIIIPPTTIVSSICEGDTFSLAGVDYTIADQYEVVLKSIAGCDSIVNLDLSIMPFNTKLESVTICSGQSHQFGDQVLTLQGTYMDTLSSVSSCDTLVTLSLQVIDSPSEMIDDTICQGMQYRFGGSIIATSGLYRDTSISQYGCDSITTLNLRVRIEFESQIPITICENDSYFFNEQNLSSTGIYRDTFSNNDGCDSIIVLGLQVLENSERRLSETVCGGQEYDFNGRLLANPGVYFDTLINTLGCDSFIVLTLEASEYVTGNVDGVICQGETYFFNNTDLDQGGVYRDTVSNAGGCDSITVLDLEIIKASTFSFIDSFCIGGIYNFDGVDLFEAGTYLDTLESNSGCDSLISLSLIEKSHPERTIDLSICEGEEIVVEGQTFKQSGTYSILLDALIGCDTVLLLSLIVEETIIGDTTTVSIELGESYNFNGLDFDEEGIFEMTITSVSGCDSLIYLNLSTMNDFYVPNIIATSSIAGNDRFVVGVGKDVLITQYSIFDRWGVLVFNNKNFKTTDGLDNFWDGNMNNQPVERGVYAYFIEYIDTQGENKNIKGTITVL